MRLFPWIFSTALGGTGEPAFDVQEGRPHCFPLSVGVAALAELDRLGGRPVFLEELSNCTDARPAGVEVRLPPEGAREREALQALVDAHAEAVVPVARYEVVERAGGWLVAPVGVERVFDVRVEADDSLGNTLFGVQTLMFGQVREACGVSLPPLGIVFGVHGPFEELPFTPFTDRPLLEALVSVYAPLDPAPVGFEVLRRSASVARPGRSGASLVPLYRATPYFTLPDAAWPVASPAPR